MCIQPSNLLFIGVLDAVQSTYLCTPYRASSLDLIQAVARQYEFARKVTTEIQWIMPQGIINGIRQYSHFLALIKSNPHLTAVPTIAIGKFAQCAYIYIYTYLYIYASVTYRKIIDLAWHTHMLHPYRYRKFTMKRLGKFLNHDDTISPSNLRYHAKNTERAWELFNNKVSNSFEEGLASKIKKLLKLTNAATTNEEKSHVLTREELVFKKSYHIGTFSDDTVNTHEKGLFDDNNTSYHDRRTVPQNYLYIPTKSIIYMYIHLHYRYYGGICRTP